MKKEETERQKIYDVPAARAVCIRHTPGPRAKEPGAGEGRSSSTSPPCIFWINAEPTFTAAAKAKEAQILLAQILRTGTANQSVGGVIKEARGPRPPGESKLASTLIPPPHSPPPDAGSAGEGENLSVSPSPSTGRLHSFPA